MNSSKIAICMATYNGEEYLCEQIDSILKQSYPNWVLFIRDDCSTDNTTALIQEYSDKHPDRIKLVPYETTDLGFGKGAAYNFMACLKYASSFSEFSYFMFSDQDDVWLPNKIKMTLGCAKKVEKKHSGPILVHTDLTVTNKNLDVISNSFVSYSKIFPHTKDLNHLLVENNITGCTMLWNRNLNSIISFNCKGLFYHDWWVGLIACCFGFTYFFNKPTILYRQHNSNTIGANNESLSFKTITRKLSNFNNFKTVLSKKTLQSSVFLNAYRSLLSPLQRKTIAEFSEINSLSKAKKIYRLIHNRYLSYGIIRKIGQILRI